MTDPAPTHHPDDAAGAPVDTSLDVPRWSVNPAVAYGASVGLLLAALGLVTKQPVFALVALPLIVSAVVGLERRPRRADGVAMTTALRPDDDASGVRYTVRAELPDGVEAVSLHLVGGDDVTHRFAVDCATAASFSGRIPVTHSGPQEIVRLHYSLLADGGTSVSSPAPGPISSRLIPAPRLRMESLPLPHRVVGITGAHGSANPGEGGEFRDVALFAPGDRLRRIDWKATARRAQRPGELYVRRSFATADAIVMLVVDDRDELGSDVTRWSGARGGAPTATSLDLAREAATSLAAAYITAGDRVGLRDLAGTARSVEPGGGTRHLERLQSTIATAAPSGEPVTSVRTPILPSSSLVVVLSTFLDDQAATMAITWAATGHRVVAVDVLPEPATDKTSREQKAAFRLLMLERNQRLDGMTAAGVERVRWQAADGENVPAVQLRLLSRPRRMR
ncbi:hypothetical protein AS850_13380 [Frondihabitans sp. 762G35]|uniref:DUF58 domain-containing protein n=1 Tax=Frondihabitans sp. 762G35 TaxID=1446794 RepID=UPI000D22C3F1|nr:DUF58 domain-containing protein [Frondihabitans sp. 762G35]ARC58069.1 hypothetical protein AS850_13380 [Frondihabitans sp. 762G35]